MNEASGVANNPIVALSAKSGLSVGHWLHALDSGYLEHLYSAATISQARTLLSEINDHFATQIENDGGGR